MTQVEKTPTPIGLAPIITFVLVACGLSWLVALPLWLGEGLAEPVAAILLPVMMYTPAAAVLIVLFVLRPLPAGERLRFLGMWPLRPAKRLIGMSAIGLFGPVVMILIAMLLAAALGWFTADLAGLSGFEQLLKASLPEGTPLPPVWLLVGAQLGSIPVAALTINAIAAFGEEVGWRGFLLPALTRWGTWPALLISGAIWGLWHSPLILLGYDFGRPDALGVLLMVIACTLWGVLLGWLRLRSGSLWPAVFAHGAMNAAMAVPLLFAAAGAVVDPALVFGLGVAGWIVAAAVIVALLLGGQFRRQPSLGGPQHPLAGPSADPGARLD